MVAVKRLEPPYEIFDIEPCQTVRMSPLKFEIGTIVIHPRWVGAPPEKEVTAIRIWVTEAEKREQLRALKWIPGGGGPTPGGSQEVVLPYWDITSARLRVSLLQVIERVIADRSTLEIHKVGRAPRAFFSVRVIPPA
jgi:hypothetical protein